jgi:cytochrome c oxidase subunit IV
MSEHQVLASPEISFAAPHKDGAVKRFMKVTWILSVITIIELILGFGLAKHWYGENHGFILFIKGAICILSLAKAYYIVGVFMHLGDEIKNFRMTIVIPLCLFIWFIIAFIWDGSSWLNLRNTRAGSVKNQTEQVIPAAKKTGEKE